MELIAVVQHQARQGDFIRLPHSLSGLRQGLDHGAALVIRTDDGEYHEAEVIGIDFELDDTVYDLRVGARLPAEMAAQRLSGEDLDEESKNLLGIVNLIGKLRRRGGS